MNVWIVLRNGTIQAVFDDELTAFDYVHSFDIKEEDPGFVIQAWPVRSAEDLDY